MAGLVPRRGDKALVVGNKSYHQFSQGTTVTLLGVSSGIPGCYRFKGEGFEQTLKSKDYILERDPLFAFFRGAT